MTPTPAENPAGHPHLSAMRDRLLRRTAHVLIRGYQLSLSGLVGRNCRHLPTCSEFTDEAIQAHGFWAGGWMGLARICRCHPWGTAGYDPVPRSLPAAASPITPWRYGYWRGPLRCEAVESEATERPSS